MTIKKLIPTQRAMNNLIAKTIGSNEGTAFMYGSQVARRLTVPVSNDLFMSLVNLCHKAGIERFSNSTVLKMVNASSRKPDIKKLMERTLSNLN
jgi:GH24 family phage-related lysozyme (muramidase)